jgi:serine/threonine protein kinase
MSEISIESPLIGNRYQLEEKLGAGGMGVVYRAIDRLTSDPVALKRVNVKPRNLRFSTRSDDSSEVLELALAREFKTLASFRHPHIISVLDYGFDEHQQPYFTMPLLTYPQDIVNYARNRTRHEQGLLLVQILQALAYLHRQGVLHRDLKPANVLVADGQVRVLDFGLAIAREELAEGREAIVGTLAYMAPEVLRGELPTEAADLYAIGVIAYEIFAGQHPFHLDASFHNLMLEILTTDPDFSKIQTHSLVPTSPDPITNDDDSTTLFDPEKTTPRENPLPPVPVRAQPIEPIILEGDKLVAFVRQLMVKNPTQRYPSAESTIQALCAALDLPIPAETLAIRESFLQAARFVGRQKERLQLEQALSQAIAGHGGAWLVGGESGVGKSRLLDELRIRALVQRTMVLRGQAVAEGGLPYQLWRDIVRRLVISTALNDLEAGILKEILPDISTLLGRNVPDAPQLDGKAAQQRLVQTIADVFKRQTQPILLLLEDLQWTSESLEALKQLNLWLMGKSCAKLVN